MTPDPEVTLQRYSGRYVTFLDSAIHEAAVRQQDELNRMFGGAPL